jgi:hypothetical protein
MALIGKQPPVSSNLFLNDLKTKPEPRTAAFGRVTGNGNQSLLTDQGLRGGQRVTLEYDGYFPPLPESEGYGSATVTAHWETKNGLKGDSPAVQDSGWWGYGTQVGFDLPKEAEGPLSVTFTETRKNGTVVPDNTVYTTDVLPAEAPIVKFTGDWQDSINGQLQRGGAFKVAYDVDRLKSQLNLKAGDQANINVMVSFDGKYPQSQQVLYRDALGEHVDTPEFRIPADAQNVRIWFSGSVNGQRDVHWDSDFGQNFSASIDG